MLRTSPEALRLGGCRMLRASGAHMRHAHRPLSARFGSKTWQSTYTVTWAECRPKSSVVLPDVAADHSVA